MLPDQPTENLELKLSLKFFRDRYFQNEVHAPLKLPIGTPIFVELSVNKVLLQYGDPKAKIIVNSCVVYPVTRNETTNLHHTIINNRVVVDKGSLLFQSPELNVIQFRTQIVKVGTDNHDVSLRCDVIVCPSSDNSATCTDRRAKAQHMSTATHRKEELSYSPKKESKQLITAISENIEVKLPRFVPYQRVWADDLSLMSSTSIGDEDYLRIGLKDKLLYHFQLINGNYIVKLFNGTGKIKP